MIKIKVFGYKTASNYAQGVVHAASAKRLIFAGQLGIRPDNVIEEGLEVQNERAWLNVLGMMPAAGFDREHLIRAVVYCTVPEVSGVYREVRDREFSEATSVLVHMLRSPASHCPSLLWKSRSKRSKKRKL